MVQGIYNLNFEKFHYAEIAFFLQVYPVLLVALYPLICITLRNNVMNLVKMFRRPTKTWSSLGTRASPSPCSSGVWCLTGVCGVCSAILYQAHRAASILQLHWAARRSRQPAPGARG